jgi:hypothetical protein
MERNKQLEIWPKEKCKRLVVRNGKVIEIKCENHSYAWSGKVPCTGVYRCVFCGKPFDEENREENRDE